MGVIDDIEQLAHLPAHAMKPEILDLVRTEGLIEATRTAIAMLKNDKTPAAARATLVGLMFRLGGFLEKPSEADDPFGIAKMTPTELKAALPQWRREAEEADRKLSEMRAKLVQLDADDVDIFA